MLTLLNLVVDRWPQPWGIEKTHITLPFSRRREMFNSLNTPDLF